MSIKSQFTSAARYAASVLSLSAVVISGAAHANECGEISQALSVMGDSYYHVDTPGKHEHHGKSDQLALLEQSKLLYQLRDARFKNGMGERTRCFGTERNWREESSLIELDDIDQQDNSHRRDGELVIHAHEYDKQRKRIRRESVYLSLANYSDIFEAADGNALTLNTRRRQVTKAGSFLRETAIIAFTTDSGIDLKQSTYINGHLAEWFSWSLNTKK